jgi:hypothetical protein
LHSGLAASGAASAVTLSSAASSTSALYDGANIEIVRGTGAGQVRTITGYVGGTKVATVDRAWATNPSSDSVYIIHPRTGVPSAVVGYANANVLSISASTAAATALRELYKGAVVEGSISDTTPGAADFTAAAGLSATDDFYNNMLLVFTSGTLMGYVARINDYTGTTRSIALSANLPLVPGNGDEFCILSKIF